jgi:hypothetical protein
MKMNTIVVSILGLSASLGLVAQAPHSDTPATRVGTISSKMSCEEARKVVANPKGVPPEDYDIADGVARGCYTTELSMEDPSDPKVSYGIVDPGSRKVLFKTISINDAAKLRDACKAVIGASGAAAFEGDPLLGTVIGVGGQVSCESYFKAAVESNPLIIAMPPAIPGYMITRESLGDLFNIVTKVPGPRLPDPKDPTTWIPPSVATELLKRLNPF